MVNNESSTDVTALYAKRWGLLTATCALAFLTEFLSKSFGSVDEILATYFRTTLTELDWMVSAVYAGTTIIGPVFAYLCYAKLIGFRIMSIAGGASLLISSVCIAVAVQYSFLFPMMVVMSLLQGVSYCVTLSGGVYFIVLWFPDNQISYAYAFISASIILGVLLGSLVPPFVLNKASSDLITSALSQKSNATASWEISIRDTLLKMYLSIAFILFCLMMYFIICSEDQPPKPPNNAALIRNFNLEDDFEKRNLLNFFKVVKRLSFDKTYLLCVIVGGLVFHVFIIEILHLSQLVGQLNQSRLHFLSNDIVSGVIISVYCISAFISSFIAAKIIEKYKHYFGQIIFADIVGLIGATVIFVSYYYNHIIGFYIGNALMAVSSRICGIALLDVITRHTYPINEALVLTVFAASGTAIYIILAYLARLITNLTTPGSSIIFIMVCLFLALVLSFFMDPKDKRREIDNSSEQGETESLFLLSNRSS